MSILSISAIAAGCGSTQQPEAVSLAQADCSTKGSSDTERLVARIPAKTILTPDGRPARLNFSLPASASQGPTTWYVLKLGADLSFNPGQPNETSAGIVGATNGRVSHQIELERRPEGVRLFWSGLLGGPHHEVTTKPSTTVSFDNYLQTTGVKPGTNTLELRIDQRGGNLVRQVTVRPGSGIYQTSHPPEQLGLEAPQTIEATGGKELAVPYTLTRASSRADTPTKIDISAEGLEIRGESTRVIDCIGERTTGSFALTGEPGNYLVRVSAAGDYNRPVANISVHIAADDASPRNTPRLIAAALLLLAALSVARWGAIRRRFRKSQSQH